MQVDDTLDLFNELQLQHQAVATKTKTLHDACDRLVGFSFNCHPFSLLHFPWCHVKPLFVVLENLFKTCCLRISPLQLIEKQRLIEFSEALRSKLNYFDELENVRFECYLT